MNEALPEGFTPYIPPTSAGLEALPEGFQPYTPPTSAVAAPIVPESLPAGFQSHTPVAAAASAVPPTEAQLTPETLPEGFQPYTPPEDSFPTAFGKRMRNMGRSFAALPEELGLAVKEPFYPPGTSAKVEDYIARTRESLKVRQQAQEAVNLNRYSPAGAADAVVGGVASFAPALAAGVVNPVLGAAVFSAQTFGERYADSSIVRGRTPMQSLADASIASGVAGATMMIAPGATMAGMTMKKAITSSALATGAQAAVLSTFNHLYDSKVLGDDIPFGKALEDIAYETITAGVSGGLLAPVLHPMGKMLAEHSINKQYAPYIRDVQGKMLTGDELSTASQLYPPQEGNLNVSPVESYQHSLNTLTVDLLTKKAEDLLTIGKTLPEAQQKILTTAQEEMKSFEEKSFSRIDKQGQLTLPLEGLSDVQKITPEEAPAVNTAVTALPKYNINAPHPEVEHVNQLPLLINEAITNSKIKSGYIVDVEALHSKASTPLQMAMNHWIGSTNAASLIKAGKEAFLDKPYREGLQQILDKYFPNTEHIPLFIGTREDHLATHQVENQEFIRGSLDPSIATAFASEGQKKGKVSLVWVPKVDVSWLAGASAHAHEYEVIAKTANLRHQGWATYKEAYAAVTGGETHIPASTYQNVMDAKVKIVDKSSLTSHKVPSSVDEALAPESPTHVWQYDTPLQGVLTGMHPQEYISEGMQSHDQLEMNLQPGLFDPLPLLPQEKIVMSADKPAVLYPEPKVDVPELTTLALPELTTKAAKVSSSTLDEKMTAFDWQLAASTLTQARGENGKLFSFSDATPGKVKIVGSPEISVKDAAVHLEKGMAGLRTLEAHLNSGLKKFLPNTHVVLQLMPKVGKIPAFYSNNGDLHVIHLGVTRGEKLSLNNAWTSISHEVGHILMDTEFQSAPDAVRNAVHEAYIEWRQTADGMNVIDFVKSAGNLYDLPNAKAYSLDMKDWYFSATHGPEYWLSMDEWFAQQVSRAMVGDFHGGRGISDKPFSTVQKLFQTIGDKVKSWLMYFRTKGLTPADFKPNHAVGEFLHSLNGNTAMQLPTISREFFRGPQKEQAQPQTLGAAQVQKLLTAMKHNNARGISAGMDHYNWYIRHTHTLLQLAEANPHVPGMVHYKEAAESWHREKMNWIGRADKVIREWMSLGDSGHGIGKVLFDLSNMDHNPSNTELRMLMQQHNVNAAGASILSRVTNDFQDMLQTLQDIRRADAMRLLTGPELVTELHSITTEFDALRQKPYFPHTWFGDYTTVVRDKKTNKIVHMEAYPTQVMRDADAKRINQQFNKQNFTVWRSKITEDMKSMQGLSPLLVSQLKRSMQLTPDQERQLDQVIYQASPSRSFKHHFQNKSGTEGYSLDAMRAYGDYFLKGANHVGRLKYGWKMEDSVKEVKASIGQLVHAGDNINVTKRVQLQEHLQRHFDYVSHPKNELQALKSLGFMWYLGLNAKSAVVNLTQVPFVALPFFSGLYGDRKAVVELGRAYKDIRKAYSSKDLFTKPQDAMLHMAIERGVSDGVLDEGIASDIASLTEGNFMSRVLPRDTGVKLVRNAETAAAYMFRASEKLNRRMTFQAAWRLAQAHPGHPYLTGLLRENPTLVQSLTTAGFGPADVAAYIAGKHAVQTTQGEYAAWNKPELTRGKKGALFLFMNYPLMMLHLLNPLGKNPGAVRMLLTLGLAGGLMGLPFAEDLNNLIKGTARLFGKNFNPEMELRQLIAKLGSEHPDLYLNGASRYGFGLSQIAETVGVPLPSVDLSGAVGLGRLVPGMEAMTAPTGYDTKVTDSVSSAGGALVGIAANLVKSMTDDNPDTFLRWNRAMPVFMRQIWKAYNANASGGVYNRNGAKLMGPDVTDRLSMAEETAMGLGFPLTKLDQKWDLQRQQLEVGMFWQMKREALIKQWTWAKLTKQSDAANAAHADIVNFNQTTPVHAMRIGFDTLYKSIVAKTRVKSMQEAGLAPKQSMAQIFREVQAAYPEVTVENIRN